MLCTKLYPLRDECLHDEPSSFVASRRLRHVLIVLRYVSLVVVTYRLLRVDCYVPIVTCRLLRIGRYVPFPFHVATSRRVCRTAFGSLLAMFGTSGTHGTHPEVIRIEKMLRNDFREIMQMQRRPEDTLAPAAHMLHVSAGRKGARGAPLRPRDFTDL